MAEFKPGDRVRLIQSPHLLREFEGATGTIIGTVDYPYYYDVDLEEPPTQSGYWQVHEKAMELRIPVPKFNNVEECEQWLNSQ